MILRDWLKRLKRWELGADIYVGSRPQPINVYLRDCGLFKVYPVFSTSDTIMVRVPELMANRRHLMLIESRTGSTLSVLKDGEEIVSAVCMALKGHAIDGSEVSQALARLDWAGYCPVIDAASKLTGGWTVAAPSANDQTSALPAEAKATAAR